MLNREDFKKHMTTLMEWEDYVDKLDAVGLEIWQREEYSYLSISYIEMLEKCMDLETNDEYGSDILFWLYDCDRGKRDNAYMQFTDGKKHYIRTLDELYDWIVFYNLYRKHQ